MEKEKDLAASAEELARRKEYEQAELDALREEAAQAKELSEGLPQQLQMLREQVKSEQAVLDAADGNLRDEEKVKNQTLEAHLGAAALYRERLGLRFEIGEEEDLRIFFARVHPDDHDKEFMVAVRVMESGGYELVDCEPEVASLDELLTECNRTDNLSGFVRGARDAFRRAVAAEEVAAAAEAMAKAALEPPEMPEVDEPAPAHTQLRALGEEMLPL